MNTLFPIFVKLEQQLCLVIGGGLVAYRKITGLLDCQATVRVVAPVSIPQIHQLAQKHHIELFERIYQPEDLTDVFLVVAATNDRDVNVAISQACAARKILCNVVDVPDLCNFYYASTYTVGDLKISISTNGKSPAFARKIKADLAARYPEEIAPYLEYLGRMRETIKQKVSEEANRKEFLEKIVADPGLLERCRDQKFCSQIPNLDYGQEVEKWR